MIKKDLTIIIDLPHNEAGFVFDNDKKTYKNEQ